MLKRIHCIISLFCVLLVFTPTQAEEETPFRLGVALCLSGGCAGWGTSALHGIELAVDEINHHGGILNKNIQVVAEDTAEAVSGSAAIQAFQSLLTQSDIHYIIGPSWTPAGMALIPILKKRPDIVTITPSMAVPDFPRAAPNLFKTVPDNATTAEHIAKYAIEKGLRSCAIISNQLKAEQYTSGVFRKKYESLGGKITTLIETAPEESDLRTPALKIIQSKPDVVFLANYVQVGPAARRLRELGYTGPFISILLDKTRLDEGGAALEGTVFSKYVSYSAEFDKKYTEKYGTAYGPSADSAYDTVYVLKAAIEKAKTFNVETVKNVLPSISMQGTASSIKFN
ncbi:MAG: ABC transporter substrate-binding protein, partial [Bdellovibrionales bacterium]|nr:ABC transporter substrate-binding protein [Bdellovibrionales bacterium]